MKPLKGKLALGALLVLVTLGYMLLYVVIQQSLRLGANEPQASMAKRIASQLQTGRSPHDVTVGYVDMRADTAPFIIIYDQYGKVVSGNGYLDGSVPQVPIGVLAAAKGKKLNRVTWQPQNNVRIASVSAQAGNRYVLVGRTLAVIEKKISTAMWWLAVLWAVTLALIVVLYRVLSPKKPGADAPSAPIPVSPKKV